MPRVAIVMGSKSDWPTMRLAAEMLETLGVDYEAKVVSAHRTPGLLTEFAESAAEECIQVIIAGAGGAAHLPGMIAANTHIPVFGVPVRSSQLSGVDSLYSIVQMPKGVAVGTLAIGEAGAANAGLLAAQVIALHDTDVAKSVIQFREKQTRTVLEDNKLSL
jgi:5-(carboxyamino)imidazole ribonucleotide mutase